MPTKTADRAAARQAKKAKHIRAELNLVPTPKASKSKKATKPVVTVVAGEGTKVCSKCKVAKPLNAETFARDKTSKDGFYGQCKQCEAEYRAAKKLAAQPAPVAPVAVAATPAPKAKKAKKAKK